MDIKKFIDIVRTADEDSILEMLFECYNAQNSLDNDKIRQDFEILYEAMNGKTLREKDEVIYATCSLCRSHAEQGFITGIKVGLRLAQEAGITHE
jgi:hypothetical protein